MKADGASRALGLIGHGNDRVNFGFAAVGDPLLGAVEHVVVAVALGGGLHAARVGPALASVRPKAASFLPAAISGRYFFFCSSVPKSRIGNVPSAVAAMAKRNAAADLGKLFNGETQVENAAAHPAVCSGM